MTFHHFVTMRELMRLVAFGLMNEEEIIQLGPQGHERFLVEKVYQLRQVDAVLQRIARECDEGTDDPGEEA